MKTVDNKLSGFKQKFLTLFLLSYNIRVHELKSLNKCTIKLSSLFVEP